MAATTNRAADPTDTVLLLSARDQRLHMGVQCRIEVLAPDAPLLLDRCHDMVAELERLWSRFLSGSDISRLNHANGVATRVDPRTTVLLAAMQKAFAATKGCFNPTRLPEQIAAGDAKSLVSPHVTRLPPHARVWHSLDDLCISPDNIVTMPHTMTLDAGGIAKGYAADLVVQFALENGATSVCVNLGGDIRVANSESSHHDFAIAVMSPHDPAHTISTVSLRNGAIATSATNARRRVAAGIDNHIQGAQPGCAAASVIASSAMWAEVWAKHALISPTGTDDITACGLAVLTVNKSGEVVSNDNWKSFTQC